MIAHDLSPDLYWVTPNNMDEAPCEAVAAYDVRSPPPAPERCRASPQSAGCPSPPEIARQKFPPPAASTEPWSAPEPAANPNPRPARRSCEPGPNRLPEAAQSAPPVAPGSHPAQY